jgi:hypothetical protein
MYLPKKLQQNFEFIAEKQDTNIIVKGILSCCAQHRFFINFSGKLKTNFVGQKTIDSENADIVLIAKCVVCDKELQVFDSRTDGYDNCVNHSHLSSLPILNNFLCSKCSSDSFSIKLSFEYQSKEELISDGVQEYERAFSWIWISPTCSCCKKAFKNLINTETS